MECWQHSACHSTSQHGTSRHGEEAKQPERDYPVLAVRVQPTHTNTPSSTYTPLSTCLLQCLMFDAHTQCTRRHKHKTKCDKPTLTTSSSNRGCMLCRSATLSELRGTPRSSAILTAAPLTWCVSLMFCCCGCWCSRKCTKGRVDSGVGQVCY